MQGRAGTSDQRGRMSRVRWAIVWMAFLGTTINYVDRANLAVAAPYIGDDLHLGSFQLGLVLSGFFWTYAVGQLLAGYLVDRYGARIMYTFSAVWWSVFTAATAVAQGFASLLGFRLLLGAGESPAYPSNVKATGEWFPKQERALATGIYDSGSRAGTAAAAPIVAGLIALIGWRGSFVVTGLVGLVWALGWALFYRRPKEHPRVSEAEVEYIEAGQDRGGPEEEVPRIWWIDLLRYRSV
jgi:ACS family D-galactonate transporter-like MFS transporter